VAPRDLKGNSRSSLGKEGEDLAQQFLRQKGYQVIERNYKSPLGEIDIIAREGKILAFVEVKIRRSPAFGPAKYAVGPRKQRRLSRVALNYLNHHGLKNVSARFDVVAIDVLQGKEEIELITNAFDLQY
jgi:putative endonuclease